MQWVSVIWKIDDRIQARWERRQKWHRWFAWHPVMCGKRVFWLEFIERRRVYEQRPGPYYGSGSWAYKDGS